MNPDNYDERETLRIEAERAWREVDQIAKERDALRATRHVHEYRYGLTVTPWTTFKHTLAFRLARIIANTIETTIALAIVGGIIGFAFMVMQR